MAKIIFMSPLNSHILGRKLLDSSTFFSVKNISSIGHDNDEYRFVHIVNIQALQLHVLPRNVKRLFLDV